MTTAAAAATAARRAVADVFAGRALKAFYIAVLAVALVGSTQGVTGWIGWAPPAAFGATLLAELGGVALSVFADARRQRGERAIAAQLLSAAFAAGAIAVQLRGHAAPGGGLTSVGYFFAGFSAAGYVIYRLDSAAKRRDALRLAGKLAETPPVYGAYQWGRHPWLTARARRLAVANAETRLVERLTSREAGGPDQPTTPLLGRAASLAAAVAEVAAERRTAAIGTALRRRITAGVDPTMATIAVHTYDLDRVAQGIADSADYPALTGLLAAELTPGRIADGVTARHRRGRTWRWFGWFRRPQETLQTNEIVAQLAAETAPETGETDRETVETAPETVETAPETVETAPETAETDPAPAPAPALPVVPARVTLLPIRCAASLRRPPAPEPIVVRPLPAPMARRAPETMETDRETAETSPAGGRVDQVDDDPAPALPVPEVAPSLLPYLAKVMTAHRDWHLTIKLPGRHPEALTYAKIKAAAGITGQQLCADIRTTLLSLHTSPEIAEAYLGVRETADATA
ncbi:hypothetical protein ACIBTV_27600 [Micromonospora sp. NPDC049366]|uniref:hypothetical protein n=1 Tax=Micromonospora sp. NPDC049366 TaxID=3364271 RepID=UPI00378805FD